MTWFLSLFMVLLGLRHQSQPFEIPTIDLDKRTDLQIIVDREEGIYLGHPTTVLLEDGKTILIVYPKGHGKGAIVYKRSMDGGRTWSDRLPVPENWSTSQEVPTIHRLVDAEGKKRLIIWSGLYPARMAVSEDDGLTWSPLNPVGDWGGIVVMGSVVPLKTPGHYLAMFHDDGRFIEEDGERTGIFTLYQTYSKDGGLTWSKPKGIYSSSNIHLCEPGIIRSPNGKELAMLLRENSRTKNSHIMFSNDEGKTWTVPKELPRELTGDRHTGKYTHDGNLFIAFRDMAKNSPTQGDWVAWFGDYEDLKTGGLGDYRIRIKDNKNRWDSTYPGVEVLPSGEIVSTTYGHWDEGKKPYILSVRLNLSQIKPN
ncbi:MAG: sialidase family protein [Candidatus Marinimicrobia bacterium]|nr:sialidase family protein [Candidatus Neomarinimicrobiota bacterium]